MALCIDGEDIQKANKQTNAITHQNRDTLDLTASCMKKISNNQLYTNSYTIVCRR